MNYPRTIIRPTAVVPSFKAKITPPSGLITDLSRQEKSFQPIEEGTTPWKSQKQKVVVPTPTIQNNQLAFEQQQPEENQEQQPIPMNSTGTSITNTIFTVSYKNNSFYFYPSPERHQQFIDFTIPANVVLAHRHPYHDCKNCSDLEIFSFFSVEAKHLFIEPEKCEAQQVTNIVITILKASAQLPFSTKALPNFLIMAILTIQHLVKKYVFRMIAIINPPCSAFQHSALHRIDESIQSAINNPTNLIVCSTLLANISNVLYTYTHNYPTVHTKTNQGCDRCVS